MDKRSNVSSDGGTGLKKPKKPETKKLKKLTVSKKPERVLVRNLYPAKVKVAGRSGERYVFNGSGAEVKVNALDVKELLAKRRGGCCGATKSPMFELA
jgi:hypothetical protein